MIFADYLKIDAVNWSSLKHLRESPLQYRHYCEHGTDDTPAMRLGRIAHKLLLEPATFDDEYAVHSQTKARNSKAYKAEREAMDASGDDRPLILESEHAQATDIAIATVHHPAAAKYLDGIAETTLRWTDPDTGIECKGRADMIGGQRIVDFKTARSVAPYAFAGQAARLGYHGQLAYYHDGAKLAGHDVVFPPVLIAACSTPPYDVAVYRLEHDTTLAAGRKLYRDLLDRLAECRRTNHWPGVMESGEELVLDLPAWADGLEEEALTMDGVDLEVA